MLMGQLGAFCRLYSALEEHHFAWNSLRLITIDDHVDSLEADPGLIKHNYKIIYWAYLSPGPCYPDF